jgi:hypothetical protein
VSFSKSLLKRVNRAAKACGMDRSRFIASAVEEYLNQGEAILTAMGSPIVRDAMLRAFSAPGVLREVGRSLGHELTEAERQQVLGFMKPKKEGRDEAQA